MNVRVFVVVAATSFGALVTGCDKSDSSGATAAASASASAAVSAAPSAAPVDSAPMNRAIDHGRHDEHADSAVVDGGADAGRLIHGRGRVPAGPEGPFQR